MNPNSLPFKRYQILENYLKSQRWKDADKESYRLMINTVEKKDGGLFASEELLTFPCEELLAIDGLWVKWSNDKFGFSVQKRIYVECGAKLDGTYPGDEIWKTFGNRVGWRDERSWLYYSDLDPSLLSPRGNFPLCSNLRMWSTMKLGGLLFSRIETCKVMPPIPSVPQPQPVPQRYQTLENYLKAQQWYQADKETYRLMITRIGKKAGDWFKFEEMLNFPSGELLAIDELWVKWSNGRFGFSVQKRIYVECGANLDGRYPGDEIWDNFGNRVGWQKRGQWLYYSYLYPSLKSSPGIFPCLGGWGGIGISDGSWRETEACFGACGVLLSHRDL